MDNYLPNFAGNEAEHLRLVLEEGGIGAWELDVRTGAAWRNPRHDEIFGYDQMLPSWTYDQFLKHVVPHDRQRVDDLYGSALANKEPWSFECRIDAADGNRKWISVTGRPVRGKEGEVERLIGHVMDISHTKRNEERLRTVLNELNHRVRNTLTIVQSIAKQSFGDEPALEQKQKDFIGRIQALAGAHSLLTDESWVGAKIDELVKNVMAPYCRQDDSSYSAEGPEQWLSTKTAVSLSMALNELATNAVKHGALKTPEGRVEIVWTCNQRDDGNLCELRWNERSGPMTRVPETTGFGMKLIEGLLPSEIDGAAEVKFNPAGVCAKLTFLAKSEDA